MDWIEWLKLSFVALGTVFGIYGTLVETHDAKTQSELDAEAWSGSGATKSCKLPLKSGQ